MKKRLSVEAKIIQSLQATKEFEKGNKKLTTRVRELPDPAPEYTAKKVKKLREAFDVTQEDFAAILNVKTATVRSWEQGQRKPADASNRLLEIFEKQGIHLISILKGA